MSPTELLANALNAVSIVLAARNSVHTWWTGILGCLVFSYVFLEARLYADVTLQFFFIVTSAVGWVNWKRAGRGPELPVRRSPVGLLVLYTILAGISATVYGWILFRFTNAASPLWDSLVLTFSVLGQYLLMGRRLENWWAWVIVNSIAVPLYFSRELYLTATLYTGFWFNAWWGLQRWRKECVTGETV